MGHVVIHNPQSSRMRLLVLPREHGAWGILAIPLLTGAAVGLMNSVHVAPLLLFTVAAFALFCLRTPVESLLGTTPMRAQTDAERHTVCGFIAIIGTIATLAITALLWNGHNLALLALGAVAALMFVVQSFVRKLGRHARMAAQLIGALGLTSTAAGAYYIVTGQLDQRALALWFANWVFAGDQVHFVQLRIHGCKLKSWSEKFAMGSGFFFGQMAMMLALTILWLLQLLPGLALVAFLPIFVRGLLWFFSGTEPLRVHRLGFTELAHAMSFGVLLIVAFQLSR